MVIIVLYNEKQKTIKGDKLMENENVKKLALWTALVGLAAAAISFINASNQTTTQKSKVEVELSFSDSQSKFVQDNFPTRTIVLEPETIENLPQQFPPPLPERMAYQDSKGGYNLISKNYTGSQSVGLPISDPDKVIEMAITNSILIDEYLIPINSTVPFAKKINRDNMKAVVDWTAFIASYQSYLEQMVSGNPRIQNAIKHANNYEEYRRQLNGQ